MKSLLEMLVEALDGHINDDEDRFEAELIGSTIVLKYSEYDGIGGRESAYTLKLDEL